MSTTTPTLYVKGYYTRLMGQRPDGTYNAMDVPTEREATPEEIISAYNSLPTNQMEKNMPTNEPINWQWNVAVYDERGDRTQYACMYQPDQCDGYVKFETWQGPGSARVIHHIPLNKYRVEMYAEEVKQ